MKKRCASCRKILLFERFNKNGLKNGIAVLRGSCKQCEREQHNGRYLHGKNRVPKWKKKIHHRVQNAARNGKLQKPKKCQRCKEVFPKRLLAGHHHKGYENPLDVQWLCAMCHAAAHKH